MNEIVQVIQSVGFPIFACFYLAKNNKELTESINKLAVTMEGMNTRLEIIERNQKINE